jgi:acyl dehydratase
VRQNRTIIMSQDDTHTNQKNGPLYLDDLRVGQQFVSQSRAIDAAQIIRFADEFDPQPFHLDEEAAKRTPFAGLVASGWHTAALTMRLLVEGGAPIAGGIVGLGGELTWLKPTRPGDVLRVHSEVAEIMPSRSRPDRGIVTIRSETRNQRDEAVQVFVGRIVVPRRPQFESSR